MLVNATPVIASHLDLVSSVLETPIWDVLDRRCSKSLKVSVCQKFYRWHWREVVELDDLLKSVLC